MNKQDEILNDMALSMFAQLTRLRRELAEKGIPLPVDKFVRATLNFYESEEAQHFFQDARLQDPEHRRKMLRGRPRVEAGLISRIVQLEKKAS